MMGLLGDGPLPHPCHRELVLVVLITLIPMVCCGGGILHVFPPKLENRAFAVARPTLLVSGTTVTVSETGIHSQIDQSFLNDNEFPLKGLFVFPLEKDARPEKLDVRVDGTACAFSIVSAEEFLPTLKELTLSMSDPSLLGLAGMDILLVRPVGIGAGRQKSFSIRYEEPRSLDSDQLDLRLSLAGERYSLGPIGEFTVRIRFTMSQTVRTVFSPTHHIEVYREAPHRCLVTAQSKDTGIRHDFRLLTTFSGTDLNLRAYAHRSSGEPGAFMAFIEPPIFRASKEDPAQDVVVLLDTSGSMAGAGFERAKAVAVAALARLRPGDRFNVMTLGTQPVRLTDGLMSATGDAVLEAGRFVNSRSCGGGTDLYNGLISALESFVSRQRSNVVLLITDGRATVGITDARTIIDDIGKSNHVGLRIFAAASGNNADTALLDRLAASTKGGSIHLSAADDFESAMRRFFSTISPPKFSDLSLHLQGSAVEDVVPTPIPDLFGSESVIVFGRYAGNADEKCRATLRGRVGKRVITVSRPFPLPHISRGHAYIMEIWAMRQLARLAGKLGLKGEPLPEAAQKAENLSKAFGFVNPAPMDRLAEAGRPGPGAFHRAKLLWRLNTSFVPADAASDAFRTVHGKVFRRNDTEWIDTAYKHDTASTAVRFLSDEYFSLLKSEPRLGEYFVLGPHLTVVMDGRAIRVEP
ncbi:MAG: VWA domain-containing protein [Pseudomonadota bacterium]